ncbi:Glycine betaine transporter [Vibrio stylophorae]|uniref:Glycine betaine transporter n=1 Tax=Vibrio stylophorae TaxID=659351 RepID=A0ABN8DWN3_9VIBR|nr:BCCT family transporter [Vibrio stylophorae]CAH0535770.1 Glycine betaine transporter [Vibrio stylophorae]
MTFESNINKPVFFSSILLIVAIMAVALIAPDFTQQFFDDVQHWLVAKASWLYILTVAIILVFAVTVMISRLGDIKLGPDHATPDYSNTSWFAMLFSAGMGIGLMFYGVAEPVMHFLSPPVGEGGTTTAAKDAMRITFFHWGLHAWAIYAIVALALAYFSYRHKLPLLPRSALYPLIGDRIYGPLGHAVDTFAVIGTLFGVATSMGVGVAQVSAGLNYVFQTPDTLPMQIGLIVFITFLATLSLVMGLDAGIKRISNLNMILAVALALFVLFMGPTVLILQTFVQNTGSYLSELVSTTFNLYAYDPKEKWIGGWTLLYWGWWISWSPFVGMFIARVSRGRTIREFIVGVLFIPAGFTFFWMTVFGNTAIHEIMSGLSPNLGDVVNNNVAVALFVFLEQLPLSGVMSVLALALVVTFFVSSSDSGSFVIDTLTSGGDKASPTWQRVFWASLEGVIAAVLLSAGGLNALQTMTIASAFPFMLIILAFCYCLFSALRNDYMLQNSVQNHNTTVQFSQASVSWQSRVHSLLHHPRITEASQFISRTASPALQTLCEQFVQEGLQSRVEIDKDKVRLIIEKDDAEDFFYGVRLRHFAVPSYADERHDDYYRAEVYLLQGGQQYDVLGYSQEQIIADAITQYERHLHFIYLATSEILDDSN